MNLNSVSILDKNKFHKYKFDLSIAKCHFSSFVYDLFMNDKRLFRKTNITIEVIEYLYSNS